MTSKVSISNLAFAALGEKAFIQSLDEASVHARYANLFYDQARRAALRSHPWSFARQEKTLALLSDQHSNRWKYRYAMPEKCIRARYIENGYTPDKVPFEVALNTDGESKVILTNQANAKLIFTYDVENPTLFDAGFVDAFVYALAHRLCPTIAPNKAADMERKFLMAVQNARAYDAGEGEMDDLYTSDWLEERVSGSDNLPYTRLSEDA